MKLPSFQQTVGFSVQDTLALYWLHSTTHRSHYPRDLYDRFLEQFPGRHVGYEYVARVAGRLEKDGCLSSHTEGRRKFYTITNKGRERLQSYETTYYHRFYEISLVIDRFYYELTKNGNPPLEVEPLHEDFRPYLAKLLSVKDVVRYMALQFGINRSSFFMAEVEGQLNDKFGWSPSNSYLYQVAREMEEENLLIGYWPDERRTVRHLKVTDEGVAFSRIVINSLTERVTQIRSYLHYILEFLKTV